MSEKVTFQELIESIAEETDNTEQFTHDFLKDFVNVIHKGLDDDGTVNIAGLGKFKLKKMDAREGFNPQTEEEITIPAHNKVVYNPYKGIREVVNAPYSHLEANLIEEDDSSEMKQEDLDSESHTSTEEAAAEQDFIPSAPPTQHNEQTDDKEQSNDNPFDLDSEADESEVPYDFSFNDDEDKSKDEQQSAEESDAKSEDEDDDDIVEFRGNPAGEDHSEEAAAWAETMISSDTPEEDTKQNVADDLDPPAKEGKDNDGDEIISEDEANLGSNINKQDKTSEGEDEEPSAYALEASEEDSLSDSNEEQSSTSSDSDKKYRNRNAGTPAGIWIAAAIVLLALIVGALYFSMNSGSDTNKSQMASADKATEVQSTSAGQQAEQTEEEKTADKENPTANDKQTKKQDSNSQKSAAGKQDLKKIPQKKQKAQKQKKNVEQSIEKGQTLWSIAEDNYGNPRLWPWIYGKNGKLKDPNMIASGSSLSVPLPSGSENKLNAADSVGVAKGFLATYHWYSGKKSSKAKHHLWAAMLFHKNVRDIANVQIDKTDLSYAKSVR